MSTKTTKVLQWWVGAGLLLLGVALSYILGNAPQFELTGVTLAWLGLGNAVVMAALKLVPGGLAPPSTK